MHRRHEVTDWRWERVARLLPGQAGAPGVTADNRLFVNAVFWIARTGALWRGLPERFGKWNSVFQRFIRWAKQGVWQRVMHARDEEADLEWLLIDSTVVRAHHHAAGRRGQTGQTWGRSRGGFSTKVHVGVDALGNPVRLLFSEGQKADAIYVQALLNELDIQAALADKGSVSDNFLPLIAHEHRAQAVIPPKKNRKQHSEYDRHRYQQDGLL